MYLSAYTFSVIVWVFLLIIRRPPRFTLTYTLFPYTTLFLSHMGRGRRAALGFWLDLAFGFALRRDGESKSQIEPKPQRSEEHTSELQTLMRISYDIFCLKKKTTMKNILQYISITKHKLTYTNHTRLITINIYIKTIK